MANQALSLFGGMTTQNGQPVSNAVARSAKRNMDQLAVRTELATMQEQAHAFLASQALTNTATLVGQAQQLMKIAPEGGHFYESIIAGYALGAGQRIGRFS